ncbi:unnamed protein product, partial [Amoebophrya sp. A120]
ARTSSRGTSTTAAKYHNGLAGATASGGAASAPDQQEDANLASNKEHLPERAQHNPLPDGWTRVHKYLAIGPDGQEYSMRIPKPWSLGKANYVDGKGRTRSKNVFRTNDGREFGTHEMDKLLYAIKEFNDRTEGASKSGVDVGGGGVVKTGTPPAAPAAPGGRVAAPTSASVPAGVGTTTTSKAVEQGPRAEAATPGQNVVGGSLLVQRPQEGHQLQQQQLIPSPEQRGGGVGQLQQEENVLTKEANSQATTSRISTTNVQLQAPAATVRGQEHQPPPKTSEMISRAAQQLAQSQQREEGTMRQEGGNRNDVVQQEQQQSYVGLPRREMINQPQSSTSLNGAENNRSVVIIPDDPKIQGILDPRPGPRTERSPTMFAPSARNSQEQHQHQQHEPQQPQPIPIPPTAKIKMDERSHNKQKSVTAKKALSSLGLLQVDDHSGGSHPKRPSAVGGSTSPNTGAGTTSSTGAGGGMKQTGGTTTSSSRSTTKTKKLLTNFVDEHGNPEPPPRYGSTT